MVTIASVVVLVDDVVDVEVLDVVGPLVLDDEELDVDEVLDDELVELNDDELVLDELELVVGTTVELLVVCDVLVDDVVGAAVLLDELLLVLELLDEVEVDVLVLVVCDVLVEVEVLVLVVCDVLVDDDVLEVVGAAVELDDVELLVDVVVLPPPHEPVGGETLDALAGSVPQSSSRRSYVPSRSRSTPMRVPDPSGTQV
jgi:hypothetical protein